MIKYSEVAYFVISEAENPTKYSNRVQNKGFKSAYRAEWATPYKMRVHKIIHPHFSNIYDDLFWKFIPT